MDKDILKLFPQKAFKLLSIKDSIRIGSLVTSSLINKQSYDEQYKKRLLQWRWQAIKMQSESITKKNSLFTKTDGEKILQIYFSQFFENDLTVHLDYRGSFTCVDQTLYWKPSRLHYKFSNQFIEGVRQLYQGFYLEDNSQFERGLKLIGIISESMNEKDKEDIIELFTQHFGEGKSGLIRFSLAKLQVSFNEIFAFFLKKDIPLNPEFAVLGVALVTLYSVLQEIPEALDVKSAFMKVDITALN